MSNTRRPHPLAGSLDWSAFPVSRRIGLLLRIADLRVWDLLQRHLTVPDLTIPQYAILTLIKAAATEFVAKEHLCNILRIDGDEVLIQTMPLVDRSLLKRRTTPKPPHKASFSITDLGRAAVDLATSSAMDGHDRLRQEFTAREWEAALRFLVRLADLQEETAPNPKRHGPVRIPRFGTSPAYP